MTKKDQKTQLSLLKENAEKIQKMSKNQSMEMIKAVEDRLLENSLNIVEGLMGFADIGLDEHGNVDDSQIPDHWHDLPKEERDRKIRLAKFGMLNSSDIPHGAKLSHATAIGIIKARAQAETGTRILNIESATFPSPAPITTTYEVLDIED